MKQLNALTQTLRRHCPNLELRVDERMSAHTSFRIGGPAALMAFPTTQEECACCLRLARETDSRLVVMGNGSNLLVADSGVDALVMNTSRLDQIQWTGEQELTAGSGALLSRLAVAAAQRALTGLEFAHGIPGTLGGAVAMNAGAYDGEMSGVVIETRYLDREGQEHVLMGGAHQFAYRHSALSGTDHVIVSSTLRLEPGEREGIRCRMAELAERRRRSQPLDKPSAGSMFKRPAGHYAAALIDGCGLKGLNVGGAEVSVKHAGFVVAREGATCADVLALVTLVRSRVKEQTGVELEMEVKLLD